MNCDELEELIPTYALGALEPAERQAVEQHMESCPHCSQVLWDHLEATTVLARTVPPADPPESLWHSIQERLVQQPAAPITVAPPSEAGEPKERARRLSRASTTGLSVAASFVLLFLGVLVALNLQLRSQLGDMEQENQQLQGQLTEFQEENQQLFDMMQEQRSLSYTAALPGTEVMLLSNSAEAPRARGMLMASSDRMWGYVVTQGLQPPGDGMAYQIWLLGDNGPTSMGIFTVDNTGYGQRFVRFPRPAYYYAELQITLEPQLGSSQPLGSQVLSTHLP